MQGKNFCLVLVLSVALIMTSGCTLLQRMLVGGGSGALIGAGVAGPKGALIGLGAGLLGGALVGGDDRGMYDGRYAPRQYGHRPSVLCSSLDIDCQRALGEQEGVERALREQAARAREQGRRDGYCEYGGLGCKQVSPPE